MTWDYSQRRQELPPNWESIRRQVIARDKACVWRDEPSSPPCGRQGHTVDHIAPNGPHTLQNLRLLCKYHNDRRTSLQAVQERARRRGLRRRPTERHPGLAPE